MINTCYRSMACTPRLSSREGFSVYLILVMAALMLFSVATAAQGKRSLSESDDTHRMLRSASEFSSRPIPGNGKQPVLIPMSAESLAAEVCPENPGRCSSLFAAYSLETGNIMYRASFDLKNRVYRSFIVHEMVHFLQHLEQDEQMTKTCQQVMRNEREAYKVQAEYLKQHGNAFATKGFPRRMSCK